jgi:hypothetical protein
MNPQCERVITMLAEGTLDYQEAEKRGIQRLSAVVSECRAMDQPNDERRGARGREKYTVCGLQPGRRKKGVQAARRRGVMGMQMPDVWAAASEVSVLDRERNATVLLQTMF